MHQGPFLTPEAWDWTQKLLRFDENIAPFERLGECVGKDRLEALRRVN